jgi:hypothetical protein
MYGPAKQMYGPSRERRLNGRTILRRLSGALARVAPPAARALGFYGRSVAQDAVGAPVRRRRRTQDNPLTEADRRFVEEVASRFERQRWPDYHRRPLEFERDYFLVDDAVAVPRNSAILSASRRAVVTAHGEAVRDRRDRVHLRRRRRDLDGVNALAPKSTNYFHFYDDFAIPFVDLHESGALRIDRVVASAAASGFVRGLSAAFAEAYGAAYEEVGDEAHLRGRFVVWRNVNPCTSWFDLDPALVARIREILVARHGGARAAPASGAVFLQRSAAARSIVADPPFAALLERLGAETFIPRGANLPEQVALFSRTRLLIGAHGAGLANMILMPPGGRVVEVLPLGKQKSTYRMMARQLGHAYAAVEAAAGDFDSPLMVDAEALEAAALR